MARLRELYTAEIAPALMKKFEYKSVMQIPKLDKVVINVGCGDAKDNTKVIDTVINELTLITGQKAVPTYARKSVANFKLREGMKIGAKVTLRGEIMYEFIDKLGSNHGTSRIVFNYSFAVGVVFSYVIKGIFE
jgi:large subunit ribosomal protein L5